MEYTKERKETKEIEFKKDKKEIKETENKKTNNDFDISKSQFLKKFIMEYLKSKELK